MLGGTLISVPFVNEERIATDLTLMLPTPRKCVTVLSVWKLAPELGCRSKSDSIVCTSAAENLQIRRTIVIRVHSN